MSINAIDQKFEKWKKVIFVSICGITLPLALVLKFFFDINENFATQIFNFVFWIPIFVLGVGVGLLWASSIACKEEKKKGDTEDVL